MRFPSAHARNVNGSDVSMDCGVKPGMEPLRAMVERRCRGAWLRVRCHICVASVLGRVDGGCGGHARSLSLIVRSRVLRPFVVDEF